MIEPNDIDRAELRTEIIEDVFNATMISIDNGIPLYILEDFIAYYESVEMYEECAGVLKAIHTVFPDLESLRKQKL